MTRAKSLTTKIDISAETREKLVALINQQLADMSDLFSQTKHAHWNVKGPNFYQFHQMFEKMAKKLDKLIDMTAERATTLGGVALGTIRMAASSTRLTELSAGPFDGLTIVEKLSHQYANLAASARAAASAAEDSGDITTSDLFIEISREMDKSLWFLESHLQK